MASVRALHQGVVDQKAKVATDNEAVAADMAKLQADQAALNQANSDLVTAQQTLLEKIPEGVAYNFGDVVLIKIDGALREIPTGDADADLDAPPSPAPPQPPPA